MKDKTGKLAKLYFTPEYYTKVLELCTITGSQYEFRLLNKHLQERRTDNAYIEKVKTLYSAYVKGENINSVKTDDCCADEYQKVIESVVQDALLNVKFTE